VRREKPPKIATALSKAVGDESGLLRVLQAPALQPRALLPSKTNAAKVWVVYQKNMRKTILLAGCTLLLGTTVIAGDFAADPLSFRNPQQDLFGNLSEMLRETKELQSCEKQQEEALQRFLEAGLSLNAAALMAHNQYPCD
jgi:hypothetical protein